MGQCRIFFPVICMFIKGKVWGTGSSCTWPQGSSLYHRLLSVWRALTPALYYLEYSVIFVHVEGAFEKLPSPLQEGSCIFICLYTTKGGEEAMTPISVELYLVSHRFCCYGLFFCQQPSRMPHISLFLHLFWFLHYSLFWRKFTS